MTLAGHVDLTEQELDAIAWKVLGSEFAGEPYANWFLLHTVARGTPR
jgi:hypothetical protein